MNDLLLGIQDWYLRQCDGDWEHELGLRIDTLDNPGWSVDIDLDETELAGVAFHDIEEFRSESNWVTCRVEGAIFKGRGGVGNLSEILWIFLKWSGDNS